MAAYNHMFEVKNTKQEQVKVVLSEQVPLSTDEQIKVLIATSYCVLLIILSLLMPVLANF